MSYVPRRLQDGRGTASEEGPDVSRFGMIRRSALAIGAAVLLSGCAYTPAGTLVDALEPSQTSARPAAPVSMPASASGPRTVTPDTLAGAAVSADAYAGGTPASSPQGVAQDAAQGAAAGSSTAMRRTGAGDPAIDALAPSTGLMSLEQAAQAKARLRDLARERDGVRPTRPATSFDQLRALGADHGARAIRDIESAD